MQEEILKIWKNKSSDFLWIFNWITKVDTTIFKFARNLLKLKFTSKAYIFATNWFSIARYKNIPSELLSSHKEFNTWEMYALNQFESSPARSFSPQTHFFLFYLLVLFFFLRLPDSPLVFTHFPRSQHIYIFPFVYSTFVYISTYFASPCPIALVHFGLDVCDLSQWLKLTSSTLLRNRFTK